jgi:hypothetical protein
MGTLLVLIVLLVGATLICRRHPGRCREIGTALVGQARVQLGAYDLREIVMSAVKAIEAQALASVSTTYIPNQATVGLCPQDADRYRWLLDDIGREVGEILSARTRARAGLTLIGSPQITVARDEAARPGRPTIAARLRRAEPVREPSPTPARAPTAVIETSAIGELTESQDLALTRWLLVVREGEAHRTVPLAGETLVGRGRGAGLRLRDPSVSRAHSRLSPTAEGVLVTDAGSRNGTFLQGEQVSRGCASDGDVLGFGPHCEAILTRRATG